MKILYLILLLLAPHFLFSFEKAETEDAEKTDVQVKTTYFINTQEDFEKWSNFNFPAGSKVLFAKGELFKGQFILRGNGSADTPNIATAYDKESGKIFTDWTTTNLLFRVKAGQIRH